MEYGGTVYIMANEHNTVLYIGVTSDLYSRIKEHKEKAYPKSFTSRYNCNKLVWYKSYTRIEEAIDFEKALKGGSRISKLKLIEEKNPDWKDLWNENL